LKIPVFIFERDIPEDKASYARLPWSIKTWLNVNKKASEETRETSVKALV